MKKPPALLLAGTALAAAALAGRRYAPSPDHPRTAAWYAGLNKAPYTPPGPVFGGAWALLYPLLGWAGYRLLSARPGRARTAALTAWAANVAAVAAHPYLLFGRKDLAASTALLTAEVGASVALVATASRVDPLLALSQVPLALWITFADLLNEEVWRRN
ncbi:MAG: tryptophan-rich sensory protein [Acetobacteraceae bacterium]